MEPGDKECNLEPVNGYHMPTNLPPQYFEVERRYREAKTPEAKVEFLEEMLTIMPKHKGTDKLRAGLRQKISKFKSQSQKKKGTSRHESAYSVRREGAAQVVIIGPPNTGKSSLLDTLTNADPEVADFPHSTWKPLPGMAPYENIQFQLIDTPPLTGDYIDPLMGDLIRRADIIVIVLDLHGPILDQYEKTLRLLRDLRIFPEGQPVDQDLGKPPFLKKILVLVNKVDDARDAEDYDIFVELVELTLPSVGVSVSNQRNLDGFLQALYTLSHIIRIYTKPAGKEPDLSAPFVLPKDSTLDDLALQIHKDFTDQLKYAKIWGKNVFDGQMVQRDYVLQEGDVVEIHI